MAVTVLEGGRPKSGWDNAFFAAHQIADWLKIIVPQGTGGSNACRHFDGRMGNSTYRRATCTFTIIDITRFRVVLV
jgi:hypothetical protein